MRRDMAKLIVKGHSNPKDRSNVTIRERDWENLPEHEGMGKCRDWWNDGARENLKPLFNYLKRNVGRPWAKVYAEICAVADPRTFEGKHLREHVRQWVFSEEEALARIERRWYSYYYDFYYDSNGILCRVGNDSQRRKSYWKQSKNADECEVDGKPYLRINGCWFEANYHHYTECREEFDFLLRKKVKRYYPKCETRKVRQLSGKELRTIGLSNEPGWKWFAK